MLTPMLVQYLVGLCCLRWHPDAVKIVLGDMVFDSAAEKHRDVDVTVVVTESPNSIHAFKAYEVKDERATLDVADVEQLCMKLRDMDAVTHRAIVSTSGFTKPAQKKAKKHGVELYTLAPWVRPLSDQFPGFGMNGVPQKHFEANIHFLCWANSSLYLAFPGMEGEITVSPSDELFDAEGNLHPRYPKFSLYRDELLLRSTEILFPIEPARTYMETLRAVRLTGDSASPDGPSWSHTHTLDVASDGIFVFVEDKHFKLTFVSISGVLQWQCSKEGVKYYVLERVEDGAAFAGAVILKEKRPGHMMCLTFAPNSKEVEVRFVRLEERHQNMIRQLGLLGA